MSRNTANKSIFNFQLQVFISLLKRCYRQQDFHSRSTLAPRNAQRTQGLIKSLHCFSSLAYIALCVLTHQRSILRAVWRTRWQVKTMPVSDIRSRQETQWVYLQGDATQLQRRCVGPRPGIAWTVSRNEKWNSLAFFVFVDFFRVEVYVIPGLISGHSETHPVFKARQNGCRVSTLFKSIAS